MSMPHDQGPARKPVPEEPPPADQPTNMDGLNVPECWEHYPRDPTQRPGSWRQLGAMVAALAVLAALFALVARLLA